MRIVCAGGGVITIHLVQLLSDEGHEIVVIEAEKEKIDELKDQVDCALLEGDASDPELLKETDPKDVDYLIALTNSDSDNIITGLVGKALEMKNVIVTVRNIAYEKICKELGLETTLVPSRTTAESIASLMETKK